MLRVAGGTRVWLRHQLALGVVLSLVVVISGGMPPAATTKPLNVTYSPNGTTKAPPEPTPVPLSGAVTVAPGGAVLGLSTQASEGLTPPRSAFAFGIADNMARIPAGQLDTELAGMKALGITWVRFDVEWDNIEPQRGQFNWADYDRGVAAVQAHGLNALAILDYTPAWAARGDCAGNPMCAPANPADYAAFAAAAAARYGPMGVHTWEIWNEENTPDFFAPAANPGEYVALLKAADGAIKQVEPNATVLTGGVAPAASGGGYLSPTDFVNGMYAAGARGFFDALADHPYTYPAAAGGNPYNAWGQMVTIHNIMVANGDGGKKIWITEYGAPTNGPDDAHFVNEAAQAAQITGAVNLAAGYGWVGGFFWYTYLDPGTTTDTNENFFGLVRADGSRKPGFAAYASAIAAH